VAWVVSASPRERGALTTQATFEKEGLAGLIPKRRGPRHAYKLSDTVLGFIDQQRSAGNTLHAEALAARIRKRSIAGVLPEGVHSGFGRCDAVPRPLTGTTWFMNRVSM